MTKPDDTAQLSQLADDVAAAQNVCLQVIAHRSTPPKLAGRVFVLMRWMRAESDRKLAAATVVSDQEWLAGLAHVSLASAS